ncbi:MAG: hypothetical protein ACLQBJ_09465 [Bryobacteraceae bacterium]
MATASIKGALRMKTRFAVLLLLTLAMASAGTVTVAFTTLPVNQAGGYYVGFAQATVGASLDIDLLCDDIDHTTYVPSGPFSYYLSSLPQLQNVRWTGPNQQAELTNYETAAVLLYEFAALGAVSNDTAGAYNFALWDLFDPSAPTYGTGPTGSAALLTGAESIVASGGIAAAYDELEVLTPTPGAASNQEFLFLEQNDTVIISGAPGNGSSAPEPRTPLLLGSGLIALVILSKRLL